MKTETWCEDCEHHRPAKQPWGDMCAKHQRHEGYGFVRKNEWDEKPPYLYCKDVNAGNCPLYQPKTEGTTK